MSEPARPLMIPEAGIVRGASRVDPGRIDPGRVRAKKAPTAFRTISEVADELHIPQHVLRFWETKFQQVKPLKRGGGRRYYRPDDIGLLRRISDLLYIQGYTIKGVQRLLRETGGRLGDDIPPPDPEEREALPPEVAMSELQLLMPGLLPTETTPRPVTTQAPRRGTIPSPASGSTHIAAQDPGHVRSGKAEAEIERLRALLNEALTELEVLRALLP